MYCQHCGSAIPDQARFCPNCGAAQSGQSTQMKPGNSKGLIVGLVVMALAVVILVVVCLTLLMGQNVPTLRSPEKAGMATAAAPVPEPTAEASLPRQGWHQENGKTYYYKDGAPLTGFQEIRHDHYYFYEDGVMAKNTTVASGDDMLEFDSNGHLSCRTFSSLDCHWSDEDYHFGNGGQAAVLTFSSQVKDCRSLTFYLEASGHHGTHFSGKWKLLVRSHGTWEHVRDLDFREPDGSFTITFDQPTDFDAITAYPTIQGNATYSVYFNVSDVRCRP